jgi:hypothetical protein
MKEAILLLYGVMSISCLLVVIRLCVIKNGALSKYLVALFSSMLFLMLYRFVNVWFDHHIEKQLEFMKVLVLIPVTGSFVAFTYFLYRKY